MAFAQISCFCRNFLGVGIAKMMVWSTGVFGGTD
jgi:hypothetical protein